MISRLITVIGLLFLGLTAEAQSANCVKSMSLTQYSSAVNKFQSASGRCINDSSVSSSFSSFSLADANGAHASLNQKCQAIVGGCAPKPPPPTTYNYNIRAKYSSATASGNLLSVKFTSSALDPMACRTVPTYHSAVLDTNVPENAAFNVRFPTASEQWLSVYLTCTSPVVSQTTYDADRMPISHSKTYSGCKVTSSSTSSQPISYLNCY